MILYITVTFIVMLLFGGALILGRLFDKRGYVHTCSGGASEKCATCSCEKK